MASGNLNMYQFVRSQRNRQQDRGLPHLIDEGGHPVSGSFDKATVLNQQFASVAVPDDPSLSLPALRAHSQLHETFVQVITTTADVRKAIARLKSRRSPGLDTITNDVLKKLAPSISYPLCRIFNVSFSTGKFPAAWKLAKVVPVYKSKGSKSQASNYRPISLLSCVSKLCERLFFDKLYAHVSPALAPVQSGFRRGDSTTMQLTRLVQDIVALRHDHQHVGMCFFDLAKAFDTVWFRGLLAKLSAMYNVSGASLAWITDYLTDRTQSVSVEGVLSDPLPVKSGVPQGSILGPLLFLLYINDLPDCIDGLSLFADDTALIQFDADIANLCTKLQNGINVVHQWMLSWRLKPNILKTEIVFLPQLDHPPTFTLPGLDSAININIVDTHRHLGVVFDSQLSWNSHVDFVCNKVSKSVGCLMSHCSHLSPECIRLFYKCYLLPIFLYGATAWHSLLSKSAVQTLEIYHKRVLKIIFRKPSLFPSTDLYSLASTSPISILSQRQSCVLVHRIKLNTVPEHLTKYNWFTFARDTRNGIVLPRALSTMFTKSPIFSAYSYWLKLPMEMKTISNIRQFIDHVKCHATL